MGFRFRRSIKVAPGIRLNLSKSGTSVSVGSRGATMNIGRKGTRTTTGIPGTGLSYVSQTSFHAKGTGARGSPPSAGMPPQGSQQTDKWTRVTGLGALLVVAAVIILLASRGDHPGSQDANAPAAPPSVSSPSTPPAVSVPSPSASPATPGTSTQPSPQASPPTDGNAAAPADANSAALATTLERLRAERSRAQAPPQSALPQQQSSEAAGDQAQAPPQPGSAPANQAWSHTTSTGTRWRLRPQGGDYILFVDLGDDQVASIRVARQFQYLDLDAINLRVDWLKSQITHAHSARSGSYQYTRDGSIYPIP